MKRTGLLVLTLAACNPPADTPHETTTADATGPSSGETPTSGATPTGESGDGPGETAADTGRIVTQNQIVKQVWPGQSSDPSEGLRVHINHLRKKLGDRGIRIVNEPGIGYRLEA